jgi:hypothetical protein
MVASSQYWNELQVNLGYRRIFGFLFGIGDTGIDLGFLVFLWFFFQELAPDSEAIATQGSHGPEKTLPGRPQVEIFLFR